MKDNYKNLENGDIIVIDTENGNMISVYKGVTPDGTAVTSYCSCTIEDYPRTFMAHVDGSIIGCPDYIDFISMANDYEKHMLYDALISQFKIENPKWDKPFTDSVYDEIKEWITYMCNITAIDMEDAPDFVYDFAFYAYGKLCKETGNYQEKTTEPVMVNKQEFIAKVKKWLELNTNWNKEYIRDEVTFCDWYRDIRNPNYGKIDELIKFLEE